MNTPLTEQDLSQLSAYLDGELTAPERADIETRLAADERLQVELESLRVTAALLGMTERVRVPRSFTLDPAVYGHPVREGWWASLGLGGFPAWATAGITALAVLLCLGLMFIRSNVGGLATSAPMEAAEAPAAEPTQAPAEEIAPEPTAEAPKLGAADAQIYGATEAPAPTEEPAPTLAAALPAGGGIGGGPSEEMMTAEAEGTLNTPTSAAPEVPPGQRNATEAGADTLAAPSAMPYEPDLATGEPSVAQAEQANAASASPPPLPDETQYGSLTAVMVTPTPTPAWIDGQWLGLPVKSALLLAGGAIILIAGVFLARAILKRRSQ